MTLSWTQLLERSGDQNLGQALVRLAGLAEAVHRHEQARLVPNSIPPAAEHGSNRRLPNEDPTAVHTEVNR
ncbi:MAG: hypothetical protein IT443_00525 [Phycisphaeraceae bacterium]|nr:hypothetical protein [Phycisphaeraceae bacterium]